MARFERDLIVGAAQRRQARVEIEQIRRLRDSLVAREEQLRQLATELRATVDPAPRYAVPDVARSRSGAEHPRRAGRVPAAPRRWWTGP